MAREWLDRFMANRMPDQDGRIVLIPMLNEAGRIVGDFSVTRLGPEEYFLVGAGSTERFHLRWWERWLPASGVALESMMTRLAGFAIAGPRARTLLDRLADRDVSNDALPFFTGGWMQVGPAPEAIVLRVSYSGELGYELYLPPEHQIPLLLALREQGVDLGLRHAGIRALGSLRLEKGFAGWGRELSPDYDPFQAGLGRFVKLDKGGFVGRDVALRAAEREPYERLVLFEIDAGDADPGAGEPVLREGEYVGYLTSAGYGHCAGKTLTLGYVWSDAIASGAAYDVEVIGKPVPRAGSIGRPSTRKESACVAEQGAGSPSSMQREQGCEVVGAAVSPSDSRTKGDYVPFADRSAGLSGFFTSSKVSIRATRSRTSTSCSRTPAMSR